MNWLVYLYFELTNNVIGGVVCYLIALNGGSWCVGYIKGYINGELLSSSMKESLQVPHWYRTVKHLLNVFVLYLLQLATYRTVPH